MRGRIIRYGVSTVIFVLLIMACEMVVPDAMTGLTGMFMGKVYDSDGEPMKGVTVTLFRQDGKKLIQDDKTSKKGSYRLVQLNPGLYRMEVSMDGFQTEKQNYIQVSVNGKIKLDFVLMALPE